MSYELHNSKWWVRESTKQCQKAGEVTKKRAQEAFFLQPSHHDSAQETTFTV